MTDHAAASYATVTPRSGAYKWYVAGLLCLSHMVSLIDRFVMVLVTEPVREAMALTDTQLGLLQGAGFVILYCGFAIPLGWVADIANRRNLIVGGVVLWGAATGLAAFANSFETLFATRVLVGLGEACLIPAGMSLIAAYFPPGQLARAVSIFGMGAYLGQGVAFIAGGALLASLVAAGGVVVPGVGALAPWQGVFLAAGLVAAPMALLLTTLREPKRVAPQRFDEQIGKFRGALAHIWRARGGYFPFLVATSCSSAIGYAMISWSASALVRMQGLTPAQAGMYVGFAGIVCGPLGTLVGGWVLDSLGNRKVVGAPLLVMGVSGVTCFAAACAMVFAPGPLWAVAAIGIFILSSTMTLPPTYAGMQVLTPDAYRGVAASINMLIYTLIGFGVGPTAVGYLSDTLPENAGGLGAALLLTAGAAAAIVAVTALVARRSFEARVLIKPA